MASLSSRFSAREDIAIWTDFIAHKEWRVPPYKSLAFYSIAWISGPFFLPFSSTKPNGWKENILDNFIDSPFTLDVAINKMTTV